jgi:DNA-binding response OmpR family regulator
MYKILIIDDDKNLCMLLKKAVITEKIEADCCYTGKDGVDMIANENYQLIVLDVMMPGMNGFETLEKIRGISNIPILMLTARNDSGSKVKGLRLGADDYLTKPFNMTEFIARVVALIRRYTRFNENEKDIKQLTYEGLTIDLDRHSVITQKDTFILTAKEFDVLLLCAKHQGKILTKKQIYEAVWKEPYIYDDANIMSVISRLRKKIEPDPSNPTFIQTIKGIGYQFNMEV